MNVEMDDDYRERLLAERRREGDPSRPSTERDLLALSQAQGGTLDYWGSLVGLPRYGREGYPWPAEAACAAATPVLPPGEAASCDPPEEKRAPEPGPLTPLGRLDKALRAPMTVEYVLGYCRRLHPDLRVTWDAEQAAQITTLRFVLSLGPVSRTMTVFGYFRFRGLKTVLRSVVKDLAWERFRAEGKARR